jgi:hypothetical protein
MAIKVLVKNNLTTQEWQTYKTIWQAVSLPNAFLAPAILQLANTKALHVAFVYQNQTLIGALPFNLNNKTLSIAGEEKSDAINLLFLPQTPTYIKLQGIIKALEQINFTSFFSGKLANNRWGYLLVIKALKHIGFKNVAIKFIQNPLVKLSDKEYTDEEFLKIFSKRNTRNYCNKLQKNFGYKVTAIQNFEEDKVKKWLETFFIFHIARWNATNTPSIYSDNQTREVLYKRIKAWLQENIGVLFSIDVGEDNVPFAMAICLKNGDSIIYHQISSTGEEVYSKYPKQKILILELVKWMLDNGFKSLDFGLGVEPYKYEYANKDPYTIRLYSAKSIFSKMYIKGAIDNYYQKTPKLQQLLNSKIRPTISKVKNKLGLFKSKLKLNLKEANGNYFLLLQKLLRKSKPIVEHFYQFDKTTEFSISDNCSIAKVGMLDMLDFYEQEIILSPQKRLHYVSTFVEKAKEPWGLYDLNNTLSAIAWLAEPKTNDLPPVEGINNLKVIIDCFTAEEARGKGYYPVLINYLAKQQSNNTVVIYTNDWNIASQKGIVKAGFKEVNTRRTVGEKHEWIGRK